MIQWSPGVTLEDVERQVIQKAWGHYRKCKTATAQSLGIAIRTLENKLSKYEIDDKAVEAASARRKEEADRFLVRARGFAPAQNDGSGGPLHSGQAPAGLHVESATDATTERAMPVSQRTEVQDMPPRPAAQGGYGKRR